MGYRSGAVHLLLDWTGRARAMFINNADDGLGYLGIPPIGNRYNPGTETLKNLTWAKLDRIHRFLRLAIIIDWSYEDLDWAIRAINALKQTFGLSSSASTRSHALKFDGIYDMVSILITRVPMITKDADAVQVIQEDGYALEGNGPVPTRIVKLDASVLIFLNSSLQVCVCIRVPDGADGQDAMFMSDLALTEGQFVLVAVEYNWGCAID